MSNAGKIWKFFKNKGFTEYGIAGLMGNLEAESNMNPKNLQQSYERSLGYSDDSYTNAVDSGKYSKHSFVHDSAGYGIAQWTYWSRKQNLYEYAKEKGASIGNLTMQMEFLYRELSTSYTAVFNVLESAKSVEEASNKVLVGFENPEVKNYSTRASMGRKWYNKFKGTDGEDYEELSSGPLKILLIGGADVFMNGQGQILSLLCSKKGTSAVVVRATESFSGSVLIKREINYKSWVDGKEKAKGKATLKAILGNDFEKLNRKNSWDFIVYTPSDDKDYIKSGCEDVYDFIEKQNVLTTNKNFILNCIHYNGDTSKEVFDRVDSVATSRSCSIIDSRGMFSKYSDVFKGKTWESDLAYIDGGYPPSARGAYLYAVEIYAKIFGTASLPDKSNGTGIGVFNKADGNAHEFITDYWHATTRFASASKPNPDGNKIPEKVAYKLQYLVSKYASQFIGSKLYTDSSGFNLTTTTIELKDLIDLSTIYQYVITIDRNTKRKIDIAKIQSVINVQAALVEAGYLFDRSHKQVKYFANPKIKSQIEILNKATIPWGLFMTSRAQSQKDAILEMKELYYVVNEWTPELGIWIVPEWSSNTKSINDKIMDVMHTKLKEYGLYAKMGLYATKNQIEKQISWKKHCEKWFLWWNFHTKVSEYKDEVVTPEFFMLSDGKNNPQPVTVLVADTGDPADSDNEIYTNPDSTWKAVPEKNGSNVCYYNKYSDMLILGDSRTVQMYNAKKNASFTAKWGAHYGAGGYQIDSTDNMNKTRGAIKKIAENKGSVRIYVVATINAYTGGSNYSGPVNLQIACAERLYDFCKNNNITAKVFCPSLIPMKGGNVSKYNADLQSKLSSSNIQYLDIHSGTINYQSDGGHFQKSTINSLFKIMADAK